jgi:phage baseplate assembly protein W
MFGYSPVVPLEIDSQDGVKLTKTFEEVARQNLLMVLLTNPGERIMYPDFGAGLKRLLFENHSAVLSEEIQVSIKDQVKLYLPYITILNMDVSDSSEDHYAYFVKLRYVIDFLGIQDVIEIEL